MANCGVGANVHVVIRVRPLANPDQGGGYRWVVNGNQIHEVDKLKNNYVFDHIFDTNATTKEVYDKVAVPILLSVMDGYNGTIFAYGQTSSGKTHTMMGNQKNEGVIPRVARSLFEYIENTPTREFLLRVACIEIYNEKVYDLFSKSRKPLSLREDAKGKPYVEGLDWEFVNSFTDLMSIILKCEGNRSYGATAMNENSSRSHIIFSMIIESRFTDDVFDASGEGAVRVSQLNLVDLAGSERAGQMGSTGSRFKEGCAINSSLFVLGNVINKLTQSDGQFINFRDSKLTRILQASLGGNAKTSIICTVTPDQIDETHSTLKFASTAKAMLNKPIVNEVLSEEAVLKLYARQLQELRNERESLKEKQRSQDQIERKLEESNRKNQELEAKIRSLNERIIHSSNSSKVFATSQKSRRETWAGHLMLNSTCPNLLDFDPFAAAAKLPCDDLESSDETVDILTNPTNRKKVVRFDSFAEVLPPLSIRYEDVECQTEPLDVESKDVLTSVRNENEELRKRNRHLMERRAELIGLLKRKDYLATSLDREFKEMMEFTDLEKDCVTEVENELKETKAKLELLEKSSKEASLKIEFLERTSKDAENLYLDTTKKLSLAVSENQNLVEKLVIAEKETKSEAHSVDSRIETYERELVVARKRIDILEREKKDYDLRYELQGERNEKLVSELKMQLQEAYDSRVQNGAEEEATVATFELVTKIEALEMELRGYEELKEALKAANEEIETLKSSEVEKLREERLKGVEEATVSISELVTKIEALEMELRGYEELKEALKAADEEIETLKSSEGEKLREERLKGVEEATVAISELVTKIEALEKELEGLKVANEEIQTSKESRIEITALKSRNDERKREIMDLRSKNYDESGEMCSQTDEMSRLEVELRELSAQIAALEKENEELSSMRSMNVVLAQKIASYFEQESDLRAEMGVLGSENVRLSYLVKKLNAANEELMETVRELELERGKWPLVIEGERIEQLEAKEKLLLRMKDLVAEKDARFGALKQKAATLVRQKNEAEEVSEGLWLRIRALEEEAKRGCGHEKEMQIVQSEFEEQQQKLKADVDELKQRLTVETLKRKEAEGFGSLRQVRCDSVYETNGKLTIEITALEKRLMDLEDENRELNEDLESAREQCDKFKGHCEDYHDECEEKNAKIEELEAKLKETNDGRRDDAELEKLKAENDRFRSELAESVQRGYRVSSRESDDRKKLQAKVESLEEQAEILKQKNDHLKKDLRRIHLQKLDTTNLNEPKAVVGDKKEDSELGSVNPVPMSNFETDLLRARNLELERELEARKQRGSLLEQDNKKMEAKLKKLMTQIETSKAKKDKKENVSSPVSFLVPQSSPVRTVLGPRPINRGGNTLVLDEEVSKIANEECKVS